MTKDFLGDALSQRPSQKHNRYKREGGTVTTLDGIRVDVNTAKDSRYTTTSLPGAEFERMRLYGLILAKWSFPNRDKAAESWQVSPEAVDMANRVVSNIMYQDAFGDDPTKDAVHARPYISGLTSGVHSDPLVHATLSLYGTKAFTDIIDQIASTPGYSDMAAILTSAAGELQSICKHDLDDAGGLHANSAYMMRRARMFYRRLASISSQSSEAIDRYLEDKKRKSDKRKSAKPSSGKQSDRPADTTTTERVVTTAKVVIPIDQYRTANWMRPFLAKHELVLPHTGKAGRRLIPWTEGKYPKMFYRMVSDPYRRIFQRKTRALGGVVVFDCSGSMSLHDDDIKTVMRASSGCSIVCYSAGNSERHDAEHGNIHLVARHGRQMRGLPRFPGNNGVDLPALKWAYYNLRLNSKSPVIWVSDGQVTGMNDYCTPELLKETQRFVKQKHIKQVEDVEQALKLLSVLQRRELS